jgi:DNA-directed RNA polymerase specialized sigma24 family protein
VVLRYWLDLSERETAETLGIATGTVKANTSRAMAALTEKMEKRK